MSMYNPMHSPMPETEDPNNWFWFGVCVVIVGTLAALVLAFFKGWI